MCGVKDTGTSFLIPTCLFVGKLLLVIIIGGLAAGGIQSRSDYLPHVFKIRGRGLLYSHGIVALVGFTALLLIAFGGVTDRLIPLFAIGAFLAFTLSQAGMVVHWKRLGGKGMGYRMLINGVGAVATGITLLVVLIAKFTEGGMDHGDPHPCPDYYDDRRQAPLRSCRAPDRRRLPYARRKPHRASGYRPARPLVSHH
jgi:hypothetical protein